MLLLNRDETLSLLNPGELIAALDGGFRALSSGQLDVSARSQIHPPEGALLPAR